MLFTKLFLIIGLLGLSIVFLQGCNNKPEKSEKEEILDSRSRRKNTKPIKKQLIKKKKKEDKPHFDQNPETSSDDSNDSIQERISLASKPGIVHTPDFFSSYLSSMLQLWASILPVSSFKNGTKIQEIIKKIQEGSEVEEKIVLAAIGELGEGDQLSSEFYPRKVLNTLLEKGLLSVPRGDFSIRYKKSKHMDKLINLSVSRFSNITQVGVDEGTFSMLDVIFGKDRNIKVDPKKYLTVELLYNSKNDQYIPNTLEIPQKYTLNGDQAIYRYKLRSFISWEDRGYATTHKWYRIEKCVFV